VKRQQIIKEEFPLLNKNTETKRLKEISRNQKIIGLSNLWESKNNDIKELQELCEMEALNEEAKLEMEELKSSIKEIEKKLWAFTGSVDCDSIYLELRAAVGGEESSIFVAEALRMYQSYATFNEFKVCLVSQEPSSFGFKHCILKIDGQNAFGKFRFESGVHRLQRVPATEASGRMHTSTISIAVMPSELDNKESSIINMADVRIETKRSSGAGGQSVNKTDSCVQVKHNPTGIIVTIQDERSQQLNKQKALSILEAKLWKLEYDKRERERSAIRNSQIKSADRSDKVRTYNFPKNRITDHITGITTHRLSSVLEGGQALDDFLNKIMESNNEREINNNNVDDF
jgi:peptide chain release factor 1